MRSSPLLEALKPYPNSITYAPRIHDTFRKLHDLEVVYGDVPLPKAGEHLHVLQSHGNRYNLKLLFIDGNHDYAKCRAGLLPLA